MKANVAVRKVQKADREKLRRDRLNEQFAELGIVLDLDRPKNDKGAILMNAIQLLNDLNAQVDKLKAEYVALSEEFRELTQEKNDIREEKASLKSDVENLNSQYQMRLRASFPWGGMDHSVVMAPYAYPAQMMMPIHPSLQSYPFFGNQNPGATPNAFSAFIPHMATNSAMEQQSTQHAPQPQLASRSHVSNEHGSKHGSTKDGTNERSEDSNDVAMDVELKTPISKSDQASVSAHGKSKKATSTENIIFGESSPSMYSSRSEHSSSNSVSGGLKPGTDATTHIPTS